MNFTVKTGPTKKAIEIDVLKKHLRLTGDAEDGLLKDYLDAAIDEAQKFLGRPLITQTITGTLDEWPSDGVIEIENPPVQSITSIKYYDENGVEKTLTSSWYWEVLDDEPARITLKDAYDWPDLEDGRPAPITIEFVGGYGDNPPDIPAQIRQGIIYLAAHFFVNRDQVVTGTIVSDFPINSIWCWASYRFQTFAD